MSQTRFVHAHRPPRAIARSRRQAVRFARQAAPARQTPSRRAGRSSPGRVDVGSRSVLHQTVPRQELEFELIRAVVLLAGSILAVLVALPVVLELAAAPFD